MNRRVNITLPEATLRLMDRVVKKGERSALINAAVRHYIEKTGKANLRKSLQEGAIARAERDLALSEDWAELEDDL